MIKTSDIDYYNLKKEWGNRVINLSFEKNHGLSYFWMSNMSLMSLIDLLKFRTLN